MNSEGLAEVTNRWLPKSLALFLFEVEMHQRRFLAVDQFFDFLQPAPSSPVCKGRLRRVNRDLGTRLTSWTATRHYARLFKLNHDLCTALVTNESELFDFGWAERNEV
jgi:hypothetical protein